LEIDTPFESELLQHTNEDILNEEINGLIDLQEAQLNLIEPDSYDDGKIILYIQGKLSPIDINNVSIEEIKEKFSKTATLDVISPSLSNSEFLEKLVVKDKKRSYLYEEMEELNDFNKWLLKLTPISEGNIATIKKAKKKYKKKKKKFILEEGIANSIRKNNALVSESLAQILANQGHNAKAIEMYNQLILNYPEKSVYFAAQIEKLKTD
jgi:tetratricopeptide (TPR) repeat protein